MRFKETEIVTAKIKAFKVIGQTSVTKAQITKGQTPNGDDKVRLIIETLKSDWITKVAGYFMNNRDTSEYSILDSESKIQDLIYLQLISLIPDLHYEDPQSKTKGSISSTRIDFSSKTLNLGIEAKHAKGKHNAKQIESEISEDIVKYGKSRKFDLIIFFIYCYNYNFPSIDQFEYGFSDKQTINGFTFKTLCIIK
jgi:hypothetical protein